MNAVTQLVAHLKYLENIYNRRIPKGERGAKIRKEAEKRNGHQYYLRLMELLRERGDMEEKERRRKSQTDS